MFWENRGNKCVFESGTGATGDWYVCSLHGILKHSFISKVVEFVELKRFICGIPNILIYSFNNEGEVGALWPKPVLQSVSQYSLLARLLDLTRTSRCDQCTLSITLHTVMMAVLMLEMSTASQVYAGKKTLIMHRYCSMTICLFGFSIYYPGNMMTHPHTF